MNEDQRMFYCLITWRGALRLQKLGMKHSSGRSILAHVKKVLNLKGNMDAVIAEVEKRIAELQRKKEAEWAATEDAQLLALDVKGVQ